MTIEKVKEICGDIAKKAGVDNFHCPIKENGRLTATLGRVKYDSDGPTVIEFSKKFLENGLEDSIMDTIRHEMAHFVAYERTKQHHGHDEYWKKICVELGAKPERLATGELYVENHKAYKYSLFCKECGSNVANYHRAGKIIANINYYTSSCCHSGLKVVQNF